MQAESSKVSGLLVSVVVTVASPGLQSSLMTEVEAVMVRDFKTGKLDASVRIGTIKNPLALENKQKNAALLVAAQSGKYNRLLFLILPCITFEVFF